MIKKLICVMLCALICLPILSGCANRDGTPDGMFNATIEGEPFILYVPNDWTDNRESGISSAYFGLNVIVSARYYPLEGEGADLASFVEAYIEDCKTGEENFSFTQKEAKLDKNAAVRIEYDLAQSSGSSAKIIKYFAEHNGDVVMLSFYCQSSSFEDYAEVFEQIRAEFVLCDKVLKNDAQTDKHTPDGMKLASGDIQYSFYVPNSWVTNLSDGFSSAYYDESGKPNVNVTVYSPPESVDVDGYFALYENDYKQTLSGYEFISSERVLVSDASKILKGEDGYNATAFTYKTVYGENEIRIMQTVFIYGDLVYSITYTAHADRFDAHLDDVKAMLSAFRMN
jgi:hypothetical protein